MISPVAETSGASIDEVKFQSLIFQSYEIVKRMENLAKNAFCSFCSIGCKFLKQKPLESPETSNIILFLVLFSKMIISEVIRAQS